MKDDLRFSPDVVAAAMLAGLKHELRNAIRKQLEDDIRPIVDSAVESAMETFEVGIQKYLEPHMLQQTIKVILEDRRD